MPTVSVILPTHNRARLVKEAIESVLAQTYREWELLIVDDGSTDATPRVVAASAARDPRIMALRAECQRVVGARNVGIAQARGRYLAFLDDDDLYEPQKLSRQVAYLEAHPDVGLVYGKARYVDEAGRILKVFPRRFGVTFRELFEACAVLTPTVMVRRQVLDRVGSFDPNVRAVEDYELWLRISHSMALGYTDEVVAVVRRHAANISDDLKLLYSEEIKMLTPYLRSPQLDGRAKRWRMGLLHYRLARVYREQGQFLASAQQFAAAIRWQPLIGLRAGGDSPRGLTRVGRLLKPYLGVCACVGWSCRPHRS